MDDRQKEWSSSQETHDQITRPGQDVAREEDEAGREDTGAEGESQRPTGTSSARDYTGVDPKDPITGEGSPAG